MDGATARLFQEIGWGNAIRYLLTTDEIATLEACRLGMFQEVTANGASLDKATTIAHTELTPKEDIKGICWDEKPMCLFRRG